MVSINTDFHMNYRDYTCLQIATKSKKCHESGEYVHMCVSLYVKNANGHMTIGKNRCASNLPHIVHVYNKRCIIYVT